MDRKTSAISEISQEETLLIGKIDDRNKEAINDGNTGKGCSEIFIGETAQTSRLG